MQIAGKIVFITGGGGGIGGGMAQAFAERGAHIVLADINADFAREQAKILPPGAQVECMSLDVTSAGSWDEARSLSEARFGPVDILCNNAGVSAGFGPLVDLSRAEFDRLIAVNLTGVFNGIATFARQMVDRGVGHIVNTSSINGLCANPGSAGYSASKFAVTGLSEALRQELAASGIGVSTLFPGLTRSRMAETDIGKLEQNNPDRAAEMRATMMDPLQLGRMVVQAVEDNRPYIVTHPQFKPHVAAQADGILAAFDQAALSVSPH